MNQGPLRYEITYYPFYQFCCSCSSTFNHNCRLRIAGSFKTRAWFTNFDLFRKQYVHQQWTKRDADVADHPRLIGDDYRECGWRVAHCND